MILLKDNHIFTKEDINKLILCVAERSAIAQISHVADLVIAKKLHSHHSLVPSFFYLPIKLSNCPRFVRIYILELDKDYFLV